MAKKKRAKPQPRQYPATGTASDVPHVGRAMEGCRCVQCRFHRRAVRLERIDNALAAIEEFAVIGSTRTGRNATEALRRAVGAE